MWTEFFDMHSGGGSKEKFEHIYIEAPKEQAEVIFYNRFGHNPNRVSCTCCGQDYSVFESDTLEEATEYTRRKQTLKKFASRKDVLILHAKDIEDHEKVGELPEQGYVWV